MKNIENFRIGRELGAVDGATVLAGERSPLKVLKSRVASVEVLARKLRVSESLSLAAA